MFSLGLRVLFLAHERIPDVVDDQRNIGMFTSQRRPEDLERGPMCPFGLVIL
ncbi:MAG: hypothetical protein AAGF11_21310 [Myxococcota bacterium]